MTTQIRTNLTTGLCRLIFVNLLEPKAYSVGDTPKYSVVALIPKTDAKTINEINAIVNSLATGFLQRSGLPQLPGSYKLPLRDGDLEKPGDATFKGHYFFTASSNAVTKTGGPKAAPGVVGLDLKPIIDPAEIYSGMYGHVGVSFYCFGERTGDKAKGIAVGLNNVLKVKDGERLSGGPSAETDFSEVAGKYEQYGGDDFLK